MKNTLLFNLIINSICLLILVSGLSFGQTQSISKFEYINPLPNSEYASVKSTIIIRKGSLIDRNSISNDLINVYGSKSGKHEGQIKLSNDLKTLIFKPSIPFSTDENVSVKLAEGLKTINGLNVGNLIFQFHTVKNINTFKFDVNEEAYNDGKSSANNYQKSVNSVLANLPTFIVNKIDNPAPGYLFLALRPYLIILDNDGTPVFYRNINGFAYDFKWQPNNELTYFIYPDSCFGLDSSYNIVHRYYTADGYTINVHELRVLANGSYYIIGKRTVIMDLSGIVKGGQKDANILDDAVQEFDSTGNLIFQWDGLDHYKITDVDQYVDLTQNTIDFTHLNSIDIDSDGNILVSARNLDEITKIDHKTGDIIWRLGGKNNQFQFINDDLSFSRQHYARRLRNGDLGLFDDGTYHPVNFSSFVEYNLDEVNKTATLINRYTHNKDVYTPTEGSSQELSNGDIFISWGHIYAPAVTEIHPDNSIAYELSYGSFQNKYRAFRFEWKTNLFKVSVDSLNFGKVDDGDSSVQNLTIYNPQDSDLTINQFYCKEPSFIVNINPTPLIIPPNDSAKISVTFKPEKRGIFESKLNIRLMGADQLIAQQVMLKGSTVNLINPIIKPTSLNVSVIGTDSIMLAWKDNSDNETGFVIERKNGDSLSTNNFNIIDTVSANDTVYYDKLNADSVLYTYRIYAFNKDTLSEFSNVASIKVVTSVENGQTLPKKFELYQNYPNPFNPSTTIKFAIPKASFITLKIFDVLGREVEVLLNEEKPAGVYKVEFSADKLASGIYFYKIKAGDFVQSRKMIILK